MKTNYIKLSLHLLSPHTVNTVTHSYDTSAVAPRLLLDKDRQNSALRFQVSKIFHLFFVCQISCSNFWVDRTFQTSAQTLFDITFRPNFLKYHTSFFLSYPNISTYIFLCSGTDIKQIARTRISLIG